MTELKIVYEGPGLSGRSSSMVAVHRQLPTAGEFQRDGSILQFELRGSSVLLRVGGQVGSVFDPQEREASREGASSFVLVLDTQRERFEANEEWVGSIEEWMRTNGRRPIVVQLNKRDLSNSQTPDKLVTLNLWRAPVFESIANRGIGTWEPFETAVVAASVVSRPRCASLLRTDAIGSPALRVLADRCRAPSCRAPGFARAG